MEPAMTTAACRHKSPLLRVKPIPIKLHLQVSVARKDPGSHEISIGRLPAKA